MFGFSEPKPSPDHPGLIHLILGAHGELQWSNTAGRQLTATTRQRPKRLADLVHPDDRDLITIMLQDAHREGRTTGTIRVQDTLTGALRYFQLILTMTTAPTSGHVTPDNAGSSDVPDPVPVHGSGPGYVGHAWDVTALLQRQHELEIHAFKDALTGIANRRTFMTRLDHELDISRRRHQPVAVLFADVDHFKNINDTHGHRTGDLVLIELAARLSGALRPEDTLARLGGDEFAIICPNLNGWAAACSVVDRLRTAAAAPITTPHQQTLSVTLSIGVAFAEETHSRPDAGGHLIALADTRMFRAKYANRATPAG